MCEVGGRGVCVSKVSSEEEHVTNSLQLERVSHAPESKGGMVRVMEGGWVGGVSE